MKKPSARNSIGGLLRHAPVALEHVGPAYLEHADLAGAEHAPVFVGDPELDAGQRQADRAGPPLAVQRVRRVHAGLGHAVALEDAVARARLEVVKGLLEQRRRARDEQAEPGAARGRQPVLRQQAGIVGRHAHHDRRARQRFERLCGIEARQEQQAARRRAKRCCRQRTGRARGTAAGRAAARPPR